MTFKETIILTKLMVNFRKRHFQLIDKMNEKRLKNKPITHSDLDRLHKEFKEFYSEIAHILDEDYMRNTTDGVSYYYNYKFKDIYKKRTAERWKYPEETKKDAFTHKERRNRLKT